MDQTFLILIGLVLLLISLFAGLEIFVALSLTGLVGTILIEGTGMTANMGYLVWTALFKWSLLAVPGFVLMGAIFVQHGFASDLFDTAEKWLGKLPGGLLLAAICMSALFGFISGSAMAGVATISSVVIPEVEKRGYDRRLSLGSLAVGGTLASLIPPSIIMIIYAILSEASLGDLFFAGIIPGLLLSGLLCIYIFSRAIINPKLCPVGPSYSWREMLDALKKLLPVVITFIVVLGGIYMGVWSAIEAASTGALLAFIICVVTRRLIWSKLRKSLNDTVKICVMIYVILVGATFINHFIFLSGVNQVLETLVKNLNLSSFSVLIIIMLIMTVLGCLLDVYALIMLSVPVFLPIITAIGYDPVWFGIILVAQCELALITPPVGVNLYVIKQLAPPDTKMADIIWGSLPYVFVLWVFFLLLILFPQIALWLPKTISH